MELNGSPFLTEGEIGGNIQYKDGQPVMDAGLESAIYISLFSNDWWGNTIITDEHEKLETGLDEIINRNNVTTDLGTAIINRARNLLNWMIVVKLADKIDFDIYLEISKIELKIIVYKQDMKTEFKFRINWINQINNPAMNNL
jgi:hypothetical protein